MKDSFTVEDLENYGRWLYYNTGGTVEQWLSEQELSQSTSEGILSWMITKKMMGKTYYWNNGPLSWGWFENPGQYFSLKEAQDINSCLHDNLEKESV